MKRSIFLVMSLLLAIVVISQSSSRQSLAAAEEAPYYNQQPGISACTYTPAGAFATLPCFTTDENTADSYSMRLGQCTSTLTNFCYTAKMDGADVPSGLRFMVTVGAYKTHTSSVGIAGYEAYVNAFYVAPTDVLKTEYFGSSDRPSDQQAGGGKIDLSPVVSASNVISLVVKYKTVGLPQYSVVVADEGNMTFVLAGQDLTMTVEGKPARVAVDSAAQHISGPDNPPADLTGKCGVPSMKAVVCDVDTAAADGLSFYARSKSFTFPPASESAAPVWVSTNATYFHFPSVEYQGEKGSISVKTAAPHFLKDGVTVHTGNFAAFMPNSLLKQWRIEKTEAALKAALAASVTKGTEENEVTADFIITDDGVKVKFPKISYSAPVVQVKQKAAVAVTTTTAAPAVTTSVPPTVETTVVTVPSTVAPVVVITKSVKRGKSLTLTSLLKPIGKGKQTWSSSGGCTIKGKNLVAPKKAARCKVTLKQAKSGKTKASSRSITVKVV
jgi:hypothetical protein